MEQENLKSFLTVICHSVVPVIIGNNHTLASSLSKLRSCLEAGKKQPKRSLEYCFSMGDVLLYPSFGALLVYLLATFDEYVMKKVGWSILIAGHSATLKRRHNIN